jgi:hypothetical protein
MTDRFSARVSEIWQGRITMAQKFVDLINAKGGDARLVHLPDIGIRASCDIRYRARA